MLKKLIKYELKATSKTMLAVLGGIMAMSLTMRFVIISIFESNQGGFTVRFAGTFTAIFSASMLALNFIPLVVSCGRFKKNVMGNEGYLTMTLPVSSHEIILSKLIVNAIWNILTGICSLLVVLIIASHFEEFDMLDWVIEAFKSFDVDDIKDVLNVLLIFFEVCMCLVVGGCLSCISVFAAFSIGNTAKKRKKLLTAVLMYGFFHLIIVSITTALVRIGSDDLIMQIDFATDAHLVEAILGALLVVILALSAGFYFAVNYFITRKLNLE